MSEKLLETCGSMIIGGGEGMWKGKDRKQGLAASLILGCLTWFAKSDDVVVSFLKGGQGETM